MARILLTWELGSGFGHIVSLATIAAGLRERGHEVVAALQNPARGEALFRPLGITCLAAPSRGQARPTSESAIATYADLLTSVGFHSARPLSFVLEGWDHLYDDVRPDAVVFDHSPFALLAARKRSFGRLQHGTGFYIPPDAQSLPVLRPWLLRDERDAPAREQRLLGTINEALRERNQPPLEQVADIYRSSELRWLATYEELDPFGAARQSLEICVYRGITPLQRSGVRPAWPRGRGPRIFAYLQADATTGPLLQTLVELGQPTIARVSGMNLPPALTSCDTMNLVSEAVDLDSTLPTCDVAVLSGGHGTLAACLLHGKPVIVTPLQFEQFLTGRNCVQHGLGVAVPPADLDAFRSALARIEQGDFQRRVQEFARSGQVLDHQRQFSDLLGAIERLAATG